MKFFLVIIGFFILLIFSAYILNIDSIPLTGLIGEPLYINGSEFTGGKISGETLLMKREVLMTDEATKSFVIIVLDKPVNLQEKIFQK